MSKEKKHSDQKKIDSLLKAATPNTKFDIFGIRKKLRTRAFEKLMKALSGDHDLVFPKEELEPQGKTTLDFLIEFLKENKKKN